MVPTEISPQCIITGCLLHDQDHNRHVNGDLFQLHGVYIYFANRNFEGKIGWVNGEPPEPPRSMILRLNPEGKYLINEWHATVVVAASQATLNHAAWLHVYGRGGRL